MSFVVLTNPKINTEGLFNGDEIYRSSDSVTSSKECFLNKNLYNFNFSSTDGYQEKISRHFNTYVKEVDINDYFDSNLFTKQYIINTKTSSIIDDSKELEEKIKKQFSNKLLFYIENEDIELGSYTEADKLIEKYLKTHNNLIQSALNEIYINNIKDQNILCKLLLLISRVEPEKLNKTGHTIALAALNHCDNVVRQYAIRVFENFFDLSSLECLEESRKDIFWIQEYKEEVIREIQEELGL